MPMIRSGNGRPVASLAIISTLAVLLAGAVVGLFTFGLPGFLFGPLYAGLCWGIGAAGLFEVV